MRKIAVLLSIIMLLGILQPAAVAVDDSMVSTNGYIVKLKQDNNSVRLMGDLQLEEISSEQGLYKADKLSEISALGNMVEYYEPDQKVKLFAVPNDPYADKQWSLGSLEIDSAWKKGYEGVGVRVAVIDSGINSLHEDFEGTTFDKGINMLDGSRDVRDETGHGTFVAGVIGATRDNGIGIAGLCSDVTIVPIKCFGRSIETDASYIISAIYEAVDVFDCDVINLSLGMEADMESMRSAVDHAAKKGAIIISAVGNDGDAVLNYPAAYDNVVGVGSIDPNNKVSQFSQKNGSVYIVAPGQGVVSTGYQSNEDYVRGDGTSFASPHVAVAAAIMKQYQPKATTEDFLELLKLSAIDLGRTGYDTSYGYGRLDIAAFINALENYSFAEIGDIFADVSNHWAKDSIEYCVSRKLFNGISTNKFEPELPMNRAMFVTVLSRLSGEDMSSFGGTPFTDVPGGTWYSQSAAWGAASTIVSGVDGGKFDPQGLVTREQMAAMLYRYACVYELTDSSAPTDDLSAFPDGGKVSGWAKQAMGWAVREGLITGRGDAGLCPTAGAKRCEVATIISRFVSGTLNSANANNSLLPSAA